VNRHNRRPVASRFRAYAPLILVVAALAILVPIRVKSLLDIPVENPWAHSALTAVAEPPSGPVLLVDGGIGRVHSICLSANRDYLALNTSNGVQIWNMRRFELLAELGPASPGRCLFS